MFRRSSSAGVTDSKAEVSQEVPGGRPPGSTEPGTRDSGAAANENVRERPAAQAGKGRPTPKRSEAQAGRYQSIQGGRSSGTRTTTGARTGPLTAEQKARLRQQDREERARRMEGMKRGEEKYLGPRDRGPAKLLARDYIDSQRRPSEYYMVMLVVLLVVVVTLSRNKTIGPYTSYLVGLIVVVIVVDGFLIHRGLRKLMAERLPGEPAGGLTRYAVFRAMQTRRLRMPAPRLKPGDKF